MTLSLPARRCLLVTGDSDYCQQTTQSWLSLWQPASFLWLTENPLADSNQYAQKQAKQFLGQEFDVVVFDAVETFNADSFAAIVGTVRAGGLLLLLLPKALPESNWYQRFQQIIQRYLQQFAEFHHATAEHVLPAEFRPQPVISRPFQLTADQQHALSLIHKTAFGHRRRPLLITADRGRGKTALLGVAAAELLQQGKQKIVVTAPAYASVDTLFQHAANVLQSGQSGRGKIVWQGAELQFIAPDALLAHGMQADVLIVDEAAALPLPMLQRLLQQYSRIVFSTTLHGYEGSGRGFKLQFQQLLDHYTPGWYHTHLIQPVRWNSVDLLEQFSFELCLLDAEPVADPLIMDATIAALQIQPVSAERLVQDESLLQQCFGLMVAAHYRTRPSDLQMLLDRDDMWVLGVFYQHYLVASIWLVAEGPLSPDLSAAIFAGKRRVNGHLLPQTLLAHSGISDAGKYHYQRIVRIAVHPILQNQGIGQLLLTAVPSHLPADTEVIGCSFAVSDHLLRFWSKNDYQLLRIGSHSDHVTGRHAVVLAKAINPRGQELINQTQQRLAEQWPMLLHSQLNQLEVALIPLLSRMLPLNALPLSRAEEEELAAFAFHQRHFDACQFAIWRFVISSLSQPRFSMLPEALQQLCVRYVLQQQPISQLSTQLTLRGRHEVQQQLREAIRRLLL